MLKVGKLYKTSRPLTWEHIGINPEITYRLFDGVDLVAPPHVYLVTETTKLSKRRADKREVYEVSLLIGKIGVTFNLFDSEIREWFREIK